MKLHLFAFCASTVGAFAPTAFMPATRMQSASSSSLNMALADGEKPIVIGVAADSGCGKSTFMRRLTATFGGETVGPLGGGFGTDDGWETNTLVSDLTTVICLDDYHANDRNGRKVSGLTALDPVENNFDLMFEQLTALKNGETVAKPIYNHVNGTLDTPETIVPTPIIIIEGLHPMYDERVRDLLDFSLYLDISDEVKLNWKVQRDMEERGHSLESIMASIEARKPDFDAYIAPQKEFADLTIEVLPTQLDPDDNETLRVLYIQKTDNDCSPCYVLDEGSTIEWTPCGKQLSCTYPGIKFSSGPDVYYGKEVHVLEMDGTFGNTEEIEYVEKYLSSSNTKFPGELTKAIVSLGDVPGNDNGTGLMQTLASFAIRELYEKKAGIANEAVV